MRELEHSANCGSNANEVAGDDCRKIFYTERIHEQRKPLILGAKKIVAWSLAVVQLGRAAESQGSFTSQQEKVSDLHRHLHGHLRVWIIANQCEVIENEAVNVCLLRIQLQQRERTGQTVDLW